MKKGRKEIQKKKKNGKMENYEEKRKIIEKKNQKRKQSEFSEFG